MKLKRPEDEELLQEDEMMEQSAEEEMIEDPMQEEMDDESIQADIDDTILQAEGSFLQKQGVGNQYSEMIDDTPELEIIGKKQIVEALETLKKYKAGKSNFDKRVIANEQWWKLRHWNHIQDDSVTGRNVEPTSAWLFNSIMNKLADCSDNIPEANIRARTAPDVKEAERLKHLIPMVLEANDYESTFMECSLSKIKNGTSITGVFWNSDKDDVEIKAIDVLSIYWQPGIKDIQASRNIFTVELVDNDLIKEMYPDKDFSTGDEVTVAKYIYEDGIDTTDKSCVVDWYYKKNGKLHYCKFVNDTVLISSENQPTKFPNGWYEDGNYPFVVDTLFKMEGTIAGYGYLDVCKSPQEYIDRLDKAIITNAMMCAIPRYLGRNDSGINDTDFMDWTKPIIKVEGNIDETVYRPIQVQPLNSSIFEARENKVQELKQTSGNSDVSTGTTASGVTAASAISQLIETGSKGSRHMLKGSYRGFRNTIYLTIERFRQFYDEPRYVRILGEDGTESFELYQNGGLKEQEEIGMDGSSYSRLPMFDIEVSAQKASAYNKMSQNELALQFYQQQFFNPQNADATLACLNMMDFDHKEDIISEVSKNGTMMDMINMLQQENQKLKVLCDLYVPGSNLTGGMQGEQQPQGNSSRPSAPQGDISKALGDTSNSLTTDDGTNSQANKARRRVADSTEV